MQSNTKFIDYGLMKTGEETEIVDLVLRVFTTFVAPLYLEEGIIKFKTFISTNAFKERIRQGNIILLAKYKRETIGIIEVRDNRHIALLFVDTPYQRKGIARELVRRAVNICTKHDPDIRTITVNSSPNATATYRKMEFKETEKEKLVSGIRFTPMELQL